MFRLRAHVLLTALVLALLAATSAYAQDGFAKISATGTVLSSGGAATTSVTSTNPFLGVYDVTFNGSYGTGVTSDQVVITSTAESLDYGVTNAVVISVSDTTIVVRVFVWKSSTLAYLANPVFVKIVIGS